MAVRTPPSWEASQISEESYAPSEAASVDLESNRSQLEYILEYVTRSTEFELPARSVHDLLSLVCEEPSQPETVPPYLLAAGCRAVFSEELGDTYFDGAMTALEQLDMLEQIRRNYVRRLSRSSHKSDSQDLEKLIRESQKMFEFVTIALRRWTFINEIHIQPFRPMNCLAIINVLFPVSSTGSFSRERHASTLVLREVKLFVKTGGKVNGCKHLDKHERQIPWSQAYRVLIRYLDISQNLIARIEGVIDPIPRHLKAMGIKREDCALHKISRHLIATDPKGYNPEDDTDVREPVQGSSVRYSSPEL